MRNRLCVWWVLLLLALQPQAWASKEAEPAQISTNASIQGGGAVMEFAGVAFGAVGFLVHRLVGPRDPRASGLLGPMYLLPQVLIAFGTTLGLIGLFGVLIGGALVFSALV